MNDFTYYADLNPRYGQRYQRRWTIFFRRGVGNTTQTMYHYVNRRDAERNAARLNEQERDLEAV